MKNMKKMKREDFEARLFASGTGCFTLRSIMIWLFHIKLYVALFLWFSPIHILGLTKPLVCMLHS